MSTSTRKPSGSRQPPSSDEQNNVSTDQSEFHVGSYTGHAYHPPIRHGHSHQHALGHAFPERAESLRDVAALAKLVDYRSNWYEDHRVSEDEIRQRTKGFGWGKASAITAFYERQNEILDGWREVDEILDSRFPEEVMRRFAMHDEEQRRQQKALDSKASRIRNGRIDDSSDTDDGNASDDEGDEGLLIGKRNKKSLKRSFSAKAVNALSGFWFNQPENKRSSSRGASDRESDLESGLTARHRPSASSATGTASPRVRGRQKMFHDLSHQSDLNATEEETNEEIEAEDELDYPSGPGLSNSSRKSKEPETPSILRGRRHSTKPLGEYGAIGASSPSIANQAQLYDKIREENRKQEMRRSESNVTLPGSLQTTPSLAKTATVSAAAAASDPSLAMSSTQVEHVPQNANGSASGTTKAVADTKPDSEEQRHRTYPSVNEERQALLNTVPGKDKEEEFNRSVQFAININLAINVLLLAGKGIAVISSNSVSLIASFVDSALDLLSTIIIFATSKAIAYRSWRTFYKYPVGKKRLEPLGVVIFSVLMIASFCQVLIEATGRLRLVISTGKEAPDASTDLPLVGIAFMLATIGIKTVMWLLYRTSKSSGVRAVAQDAENDVVFNVVSLIFPVIGAKLGAPALDPIGGIVLSIYIIYEWLHTLFETVSKLSGSVASSEEVSKCLYLVTRFNSVRSVSAFELFHAGDDFIAEADVVLPQSISLKEAHDLGEIITYCTESVEGVERAYIHLDYNPSGQSGHIGVRG